MVCIDNKAAGYIFESSSENMSRIGKFPPKTEKVDINIIFN